jgi:hypothetical protein
MNLTRTELLSLGGLVLYVAFASNPPPSFVTNVLSSPVGHGVVLLGILYVTIKVSFIVGLFSAIAYLASSRPSFEFLDPKEQTPPKEQPTASGVPNPAISGMLDSILNHKKGDVRLPQTKGKDVTAKPASEPVAPKPTTQDPTKGTEHFAPF